MDELNQNESAVIEEVAENQEAMKCDSCGNHGGKQKNNNSTLLKAGIALMFATSVLSLGVSCYQIFSKEDNEVEQAQNMIGSVNDKKDTYSVSDDGYLVVNGTKTDVKITSDGESGISVVDVRTIELDPWGIDTQILMTMSDGSYKSSPTQRQILSEHFYEAASYEDVVRLATEFKVPNIRLTNSLNVTEAIEFVSNTCIDLNGKTLNYAADDALVVADDVTLEFKNGTVNFQTEVAVSVEGENAGVSFDGVKVNATAVVVETLEENASIKVVNSTIKTVQPEVANYAVASYESLFVVKGANATVEVKGTKVETNRVVVSAKEDAEAVTVKVESTEFNTSAPVLDINTDEVVPTLELDNAVLTAVELNTSVITSGNFNFNPTDFAVAVEGETFEVDGKCVLAANFNALVDVVEEGATITLTRDIVLETTLNVNKKVTIDLAGYKMSCPGNEEGYTVIFVSAGGDLTIEDSGANGTIDGVAENNWDMAIWVDGGNLTINNGTITNLGATEHGKTSDHFDLIYSTGGNITINGGEFLAETPKWTINMHDDAVEKTNIVVKGGYFLGFNPAEPQTERKEYAGLNYVAKGYMVGRYYGMYIVAEAEYFAEALEYGVDYVAVNANVTLSETVEVSKNLTIDLLGNTLSTLEGEYSAFDLYAGNIIVKNGTIKAYYDAFCVLGASADVSLELCADLTVVSETGNCVYIRGAGASLVTSANLTAKSDYAAIQGNGSNGAQVESITVKGGVVHGGDAAIYMPNAGTLTITGGEFVGKTAVYIKSGEVIISGGRFVANGEYAGFSYNNNGWDPTGDAIVIDACAYPGGNPVVTITDGIFESVNADAIAYYSYQGNTATISAEGYEVATYVVATSEAELAAAIADTTVETIIIGADITVNTKINIVRDVTINLGGRTIKSVSGSDSIFDINGGNVVFDNGTVNAYYDAFAVYGKTSRAVLTLGSKLTVVAENGNCVYIRGAGANLVTSANLKVNNDYAAIQGNGSEGAQIESITITGGKVEGGDAAIYMPNAGTLTITGGEFKGKTAVYIKSGETVISGGKFIATGTYASYLYNNNGWNPTGDALVIDSCGNPGGYPVVTVTGGEFVVADSNSDGIALYMYRGNNAEVVAPNYTVDNNVEV